MSDNPDIDGLILDEIRACIFWAGGYGPRHIYQRNYPWYYQAGVPYRPSEILGQPLLTAERKVWQRTLENLEAEGRLVRVGTGRATRTTHLRPTPSTVAHWLAEADTETGKQIIEGLRRCLWGPAIIGQVVGAV